MQFLGFRVLIKRIKAIRFMMADKTVPLRKKAIIVAGIVYLFLPFDIIPPIIFPFGFIDDIIVWALILWYLSSELDKYWIGEKPKDYSRKFRGKTVVDDVEYDVDEGEPDQAGSERTDQAEAQESRAAQETEQNQETESPRERGQKAAEAAEREAADREEADQDA